MSAEEERDAVAAEETPGAEKPAAKKARVKNPGKAAKAAAKDTEIEAQDTKAAEAAEGKAADGKAAEGKAGEGKKPATKKATKEPVAKDATKEPVAQEPAASESKKVARSASGKPSRRRVVQAHARYVRTSARKARMVCGHIRGKTVPEARAILEFTPREVARDWSKLLESAVANAENNHELLEEDLVVREAYADEGPTIKRFRPRAMGRATPIHKRTSHLTITLTPGS
jgi:ribosomal protein L22